MINRAAIILKYKPKAVKWINAADPYVANPKITLEEVNHERTVYLISDEVAEEPDSVEFYVVFDHISAQCSEVGSISYSISLETP